MYEEVYAGVVSLYVVGTWYFGYIAKGVILSRGEYGVFEFV